MLKIAWDKIYAHPLPEGHRFPMEKYNLLPEQLIHEGTITNENIFTPVPVSKDQILRSHEKSYLKQLETLSLNKNEERRTGFPLSKELVEREITIMGGTLMAAEFALEFGIAFNIAGGTHHAYTNRGEGFCLLNDIAIAANHLLDTEKVKKILVVDLDVHQGNGTAQIFQHDSRVFTFSMHGKNNYPMHKEKSDLDIELEDGCVDRTYLDLLSFHLPKLISEHKPEFIFYQSGVDVLETDKLGRLSLSLDGCKKRDETVLEQCYQNQIPIACSMGGGYSEKIKYIIEAHANTYRLAQYIFF